MRKFNLWMMAAILILCGLSTALTSCKDSDDGPKGTPISAEQLNKMWYAEATKNYTFADGRQEQLKQVTVLNFSENGTGREYSFYVDADNEVCDDADGLLGIEFTYTNNDGVIRTTRKDILNDATADLVREFRYQDGKLVTSNADLSLSPATDAQKAQLEAWLPDGANGLNPNNGLGLTGFNTSSWRAKQDIFLYTGKDYDVADVIYRGYIKVPLPWNDSDRQSNLPMNFCDDITPENGWELVMNRCGSSAIANENFFALYNKYLGILRMFYYMPAKSGDGNDHYWCVRLNGDMVYRSPMIYSMPQDVTITKPETFGLEGVSQSDKLYMSITPWTEVDLTTDGIVPRQGWWAFDLDLSTYRPDVDLTDNLIKMWVDETTTSNVSLVTALQGSIDGSLKGDINLQAQFQKGNKAAKVCGTVFKALKGAADIGAGIASFIGKDPAGGIANIGNALGTIGDICTEYGQDKLTGFKGTMNATINLALTANASTEGTIKAYTKVDEIVSSEMSIGKNFKLKGTGLGKGVWSLKSSPKIYMTNVMTTESLATRPYGCVWFFDPSSIEVDLNPEVFGDDVDSLRVDAVCLVRDGTSWSSIDKYRSALGLKDRKIYQSNYTNSNIQTKIDLSDLQAWNTIGNFYSRENLYDRMPEDVCFPISIMHKSSNEDLNMGIWGAGMTDNLSIFGTPKFIIEPIMSTKDESKCCTAPPVVVNVVVTVKLKSNGKKFMYSGEFLPEIEFLPWQLKADEWEALWNRVKTGPSYYQKYPDYNPTYELHKQRMQDKMKLFYPNAIN